MCKPRISIEALEEDCAYCGKPLYWVTRIYLDSHGRDTDRQIRTGPFCDTPACTEKRAAEPR